MNKKLSKEEQEKMFEEIRKDMEKIDKKEKKVHAKISIYRGLRGGIGGPPDDEVSKALEQMIGATIIDAGFVDSCHEGGLAFDFTKDGEKKRLVIGYNDLGEWVEFLGKVK